MSLDNALPTYDDILTSTLKRLEDDPGELRGQKLSEHSPKFSNLLSNLRVKQKAMVYSQFRRVEGIGILQLVLRANGFSRFRLDSQGSLVVDDPAKPQFIVFEPSDNMSNLLKFFNGDLKDAPVGIRTYLSKTKPKFRALLITQSAAEGVNLRGVRIVHVLEPFWNEVRVQQVIGRAARVDSHAHLPPSQRNVDVYRYVMRVPEGHTNFIVRNSDNNFTSDEMVLASAKQKMVIVREFLDALRASAIDCKTDCFKFLDGLDPGTDVRDLRPATRKMHVITQNGKMYVLDPESGKKYRYDVWQRERKLVPL